MTLREKQSKFARMVQDLLSFIHKSGYEVTFGDAYRDPRCPYGSEKSLHKKRLAIDLNLFKDGKYLSDTRDYRLIGEYWESIDGTWGGRFDESKPGAGDGRDGNHFSLSHEGMF